MQIFPRKTPDKTAKNFTAKIFVLLFKKYTLLQVLRGNIASNEEQMVSLRTHIPEVRGLIGQIDHQIDVMNHSVTDQNVGIQENLTRNYEDLTQRRRFL